MAWMREAVAFGSWSCRVHVEATVISSQKCNEFVHSANLGDRALVCLRQLNQNGFEVCHYAGFGDVRACIFRGHIR